MSTILGIDLGERRIGLALAERDGGGAMPLSTLRRAATIPLDADGLRRVIAEHRVVEIVVGLPLEASGTEGPQAALTRTWVNAIAPMLAVPMTFRDERLTSHLAKERLGPMKRGRSGGPPSKVQRDAYRARVDREAATIILQDELDARGAAALGAPSASAPGAHVPDASNSGSRSDPS